MNDNNNPKTTGRVVHRAVAFLLAVMLAFSAAVLAGCGGDGTTEGQTSSPATGTPTGGTTDSGTTADPTVDPGTSGSATESGSPTTPPEDGDGSKKLSTVYYSPSSIELNSGRLYVADSTNFAVYRMTTEGKTEKTGLFDEKVEKVLCANGMVYALVGERNGRLVVMDSDLKVKKTILVGHTPSDLYIKGAKAYVANRFSNTVSVVDLDTGKVTSAIEVSREPSYLAAAGNSLYVGCRLQDGKNTDEVLSSKIVKIDMTTDRVVKTIALQDGATNVRGMAVSPDGKWVYVTHTVARYTYPTSQLDRGWVNTNGFSVIETATDQAVGYLLDDVELGAGNPWDVEVAEEGKTLIFSIAGTGELITVDQEELQSRTEKVAAGKDRTVKTVGDIINHIEFLSGAKKRIRLPGEGVRDILVDGEKVYAGEYFSGTLSTVAWKTGAVLSSVEVGGKQPEKTPEREGESLWYNAAIAYQQWESCSSCHPDARSDGLFWDEGGDGWGTPKNTKSMIFSFRTPPVLMTGMEPTGESNVHGSFVYGIASTATEEQIESVYAFLRAQLPVESPYLTEEGSYSEAALRGKALFEEVGCAVCHPAPLYTDMQMRKSPYLGADGSWENRAFVTPTLVEIWRSAPYTYAGCETDVTNVVKRFANRELTEAEAKDLAEFVLSIGTVEEYYGIEQTFGSKDGESIQSKLTAGLTLESFTLRKQLLTDRRATVKAKLVDAAGKVLEEKSFDAGKMSYDAVKSFEWGLKVPSDFQKGGYLLFEIVDENGNALATPLKFRCNG